MKDVAKMRLGILKELKDLIRFFEHMERTVKDRREDAIYPAYIFIKTLAYHMNYGDLTTLMLELHQELLHAEYNTQQEV